MKPPYRRIKPLIAAHWPLLLALLAGLALRLALWGNLPRQGLIGDEAEYLAAADWLANGRGFAWHTQYLWTRAPLYPLFLAAHIALFGRALEPIFVTQTALSLLNVGLVYALGRGVCKTWEVSKTSQVSPKTWEVSKTSQVYPPAGLAALLAALYLPFAVYAQLLLSETLFTTLLLGALLLLGRWARGLGQPAPSLVSPLPHAGEGPGVRATWLSRNPNIAFALRRLAPLAAAAALLGLATLTRGLTLGFVPVVAGWVLWCEVTRGAQRAAPLRPRSQGEVRRPAAPHPQRPESSGASPLRGSWRPRWGRFILHPSAFILCFALTLLPWTVYASRAYGGLVVVDTTGAFNLLLGARTAFDGGRSDAPARNVVLALLDPTLDDGERRALLADQTDAQGRVVRAGSCLYRRQEPRLMVALGRPVGAITQAERQQLMSAEALCLLRAAPGAFVRKSLIELIDLFQINYTGAERLTDGFALGWVPRWYALALFLLDDTLYVLALPLAVLGWARLRTHHAKAPIQHGAATIGHDSTPLLPVALCLLIGLWLLYNLATAPLLFAINRFRVPLMPLVFVLATVHLGASFLSDGARRSLRHDEPGSDQRPKTNDQRRTPGRWSFVFGQARKGVSQLGPRKLPDLLKTCYGRACAALALLLGLAAITPYAYLEPRREGADSRWASYLGPYPSALASALRAWQTRPAYEAEQRLADALGRGDAPAAQAALADPALPGYAAAVGGPLLDGLLGRPEAGLERLATQPIRPLEDWQRSLVAGELLRRMGEDEAARREFGPTLVDDWNPLDWAWRWLDPPPAPGGRIELAEDGDMGYIRGFSLGRFDPDLGATVRWALGDSWLRFPQGATGSPQQLCLSLSGLGWPADLALPEVRVSLVGAGQSGGSLDVGAIALRRELRLECLSLPQQPAGADLIIRLQTPTFVPGALDLIGQQGPQVGQLRLLALQLDWAELR